MSQSSHAVRHVDIRPSFAQGIHSDVTAKPIGETVNTGYVNGANVVSDISAVHTISVTGQIVRENVVSDLWADSRAIQTVSRKKQKGISMLKKLITVVIDSTL